jgi:hypothetical protein
MFPPPAGAQVATLLGSSFISASILAGLGGLFGLPATRQLGLPPFATSDDLGFQFALWTIPYVVATLAYYSLVKGGTSHR